MPKRERGRIEQKMLALWSRRGNAAKWTSYKDIVGNLKSVGVSERTVARYLSALVAEQKLEKMESGYKKTFYRPAEKFWESLSRSKQFSISEESLSRIGKYVMDVLEKTTIDAKETTKLIEELVQEKYNKLPENEKDSAEGWEKAIDNVFSEAATEEDERRTLDASVDSLLKDTIYHCLTNPYVLGRIADTETLASILQDDIWDLVSRYIDVWVFLYKHPGTVSEFKRYVKISP
jgi:signal recognition particle GTPase